MQASSHGWDKLQRMTPIFSKSFLKRGPFSMLGQRNRRHWCEAPLSRRRAFYVFDPLRHSRPTSIQMHLETSSNIYGVTVNPFNRSLTAGGSSGGEGALLGMRGSCLGIGTDIGGSIRSPA